MTINNISVSRRLLGLMLILLLMAGCARFNAGLRGKYSRDRHDDSYAHSDLDELLSFGANFANKSSASRAETCRSLLNRQGAGVGIQLHLLTGRLLSDACGDIPKILAGVDSIPARNLPDEQVRWLVSIQTEALKRMHNESRRLGSLERKHKTVQSVLESQEPKASPKGSKESKKDEARLLRDKLEAIRAMEKKLDETGDGN